MYGYENTSSFSKVSGVTAQRELKYFAVLPLSQKRSEKNKLEVLNSFHLLYHALLFALQVADGHSFLLAFLNSFISKFLR